MKRNLLKLLIILLVLIPFSVSAYTFSRSLTVGSVGQDVLELQRFLNKDVDTRVSISGAGSPGNETNYFGNATKSAVLKFQNKYKGEVLTPVGLSYGTGFFGQSTIAAVNKRSGGFSIDIPNPVNPSVKAPKIFSISPKKVRTGDYVTIKGEGFDAINGNSIIDNYSGANMYKDIRTSNNGTELSFRVDSLIPYFATGVAGEIDGIDFDDFFDQHNSSNYVYIKVVNTKGISNIIRYELIINEL